jgi:hypothetical protein
MKKLGVLRVPLLDEILGLDIAEMGEPLPDFNNDAAMLFISTSSNPTEEFNKPLNAGTTGRTTGRATDRPLLSSSKTANSVTLGGGRTVQI